MCGWVGAWVGSGRSHPGWLYSEATPGGFAQVATDGSHLRWLWGRSQRVSYMIVMSEFMSGFEMAPLRASHDTFKEEPVNSQLIVMLSGKTEIIS